MNSRPVNMFVELNK